MTSTPLHKGLYGRPAAYPEACEPLEEVGAAQPADAAAALGFALARLAAVPAGRPLVLVTTTAWLRERGRPFARGLARWSAGPERLVWVRADKEADALWALEEALKSGAVAGGLATVERPAFVVTRRLDFAARAGGAAGLLVRVGPAEDLSAARRRWRIAGRPSGGDGFDAAAPGPARLRAELVRRRDGPPGGWDLEQDDETGRLRMDAGLADHRLDAGGSRPDRRRPAPAAA
jgi:protein ImuA